MGSSHNPAPQVALVIGGSGSIGSAICTKLAEAGITIAVGYHTAREPAEALAASLPCATPPHTALRAPVTDSAALATLAEEIEAIYGRCDILVNSAGTTRFVPHPDLHGLDDTLIDRILATNIRGPFAAIRALRPLLARSGAGVVVNISSVAGVTAVGSNIMYCASKAALDNLTKSLARALAPEIRVVSISPGLVDTEFVKKLDQGWRDEQAARTPLGRLAAPEEVAGAVLAVVSHLTFTTGAIIEVNGGRPLS